MKWHVKTEGMDLIANSLGMLAQEKQIQWAKRQQAMQGGTETLWLLSGKKMLWGLEIIVEM